MRRTTLLAVALAHVAVLLAGCGAPRRPVEAEETLLGRRKVTAMLQGDFTRSAMSDLCARAHAERQKDPNASIDVLILSGGGDWGAFGTGFLIGWGETKDPAARRPVFDVVSGVSTGALIAPFAFLGTPADLKKVDDLYRNPKEDWVKTRGILFFLPDNASFAEVPGLERELDGVMTMEFAQRVADETETGRLVIINTTNLDDGSQQPFRWGVAAQRAVKDGNLQRLQNILLASSGIPGAFPPRDVDGSLYVDGGVTSNIIYGGAMKREDGFGATWKRLYPNEAPPTLRYWVILNNYAVAQPRTVQPTWPAVIERALEVAVRASTMVALRHLYAMAEVTKLRGDGNVEVRWVAVPNSWKPPEEGIFKATTMRSLSDVGRAMGEDPASWHTEAP